MRFEGRVALITAAASGIGRATAEIIGAEGGTVVAVDADEGRLKDAVAAIQATGGRAHAHRADALDASQVDAVVERVLREHGHIDILVNAVGGSTIIPRPAATVDELTLAEWQQLLAFNLDGTFLFSHALAPVMKRPARWQDREHLVHRGPGNQREQQQRLCRGQGRHHRLHQEAGAGARARSA